MKWPLAIDRARFLTAVFLLASTAGCQGHSAQKTYTNEEGNYRVSVAGTIKHSKQTLPTRAGELTMVTMESVDGNKASRTVIYSDYPPRLVQSTSLDKMLEGAVRGMEAGGGWHVESSKPVVLDGHPGREVQFSVTFPGLSDRGAGKARLYMVGNRLYQAIIVGPASKLSVAQIDDFVNSFALLHQVAAPRREPDVKRLAVTSLTPAQTKPQSEPAQAPAAIGAPAADKPPAAARSEPEPARGALAPMPDDRAIGRQKPAPNSHSRPPSSRPANTQPGAGREATRVAQVGDAGPDPSKAAEIAIDLRPGDHLSVRPEPNGRERDRFRDLAPRGAVLVGARIGYIEPDRDKKVGMIQPIYQAGSQYQIGRAYGKNVPPSITVVARPGYAVGAINTRTGLFLDAFQLVFMKVEDGRLDPTDSYQSDWLGDPRGGGDGGASGDGNPVVGIHGRTRGREVDMLGIVVSE